RAKQVEPRDAAARAADDVLRLPVHEGGAVVGLCDLAGDQANGAAGPIFAAPYQRVFARFELLAHELLGQHPLRPRHSPAVLVEAIDLVGQLERLLVALRHEQAIGEVRIVQPPGGIDARRDAEAERGSVDITGPEARRLDQRAYAGAWEGVHDAQAGQH